MGIKADPKRPGTFIAQYTKRHPVTRQPVSLRRIGITSKAEANRIYAQLILKVEERLRASVVPTWEQIVTKFLEQGRIRGLSEQTVHGQETCLYAHTMETWGNRLIDSINANEIRDLLNQRLGARSPSHQKFFLRIIRAVFNYALEGGHINRNPCPSLKFKVSDKIRVGLTEAQANQLLKTAREIRSEWYPHWTTALYTGMRNGELYALTWDKVNFETRTILVNQSWNNKDGFKSTKSGDDRIVEIADGLMPVLRELRAEDPESRFVLPRLSRWDAGRQAYDLRMFLAGMGCQPIRFHDLRASWATMLLSKGIEPIKVMKMGGWKDMETMMMYVRKAGVDIRGALAGFQFHAHHVVSANVLSIAGRSDL